MNRREFLQAGAGALTLAGALRAVAEEKPATGANGLALWNEDPAASASLAVPDASRIRLLQITDIHFYCLWFNKKIDPQTVDNIRRLVDTNQPELVMVTGDLWHDNPFGHGREYMEFAIAQLEAMGVPWLFTWGNHDDLDDFAAGHAAMTRAKNSLYRGGPGGGCYSVQLTDKDGAPVWDLLCLNTTDLGMQPQQQQWLREEKARRAQAGKTAANAFAVFHIPLQQYDELWTQKSASGVKFENVCKEHEDGSSFAAIKDIGTVRACFCGHDHVNDYSGSMDGIELVYGRATGVAGYGGDKVPKGAKLIVANAQSGQYEWKSVYPDGETWKPQPGSQIDVFREDLWQELNTPEA